MATRTRIAYFDNLKGLLLFLVIFGHIIENRASENQIFYGLYTFLYSFHMPIFIFISGFFSKKLENIGTKSVNLLLVPYVVFSVAMTIFFSILNHKFSVGGMTTPIFAMWYLLSLFCMRITLHYVLRLKFPIVFSVIIAILSIAFREFGREYSVMRTLYFYPFFILGYKATSNQILQFKKQKRIALAIGISVSIATIIFWNKIYFYHNSWYQILWQNRNFSELEMSIKTAILFRTITLLSAFGIGILLLSITPSKSGFFTKIGVNSLAVYIFHQFFVFPIVQGKFHLEIGYWYILFAILYALFLCVLLSKDGFTKLLNIICDIIKKLLLK